ncbi:M50 family metallopeptidase [Clostridium sp. MSJ-11]|uniref:M50 family metallopeptidase n=1 Tax=Clostridium mobile TaxID=2841512 RepID=A0ABS6EFM0_9CLOT|nr:M50 family metallopeptidase [Clostridium mobile]MBU5483562.1 M50 family metallopeptidase [Clostridium mobile]
MIKINKYFIPYLLILFYIGYEKKLLFSLAIVILHEGVHYLVARYFGFAGFQIEILPVGTVLKLRDIDEASTKEELIISLSAPLINLILAAVFYILFTIKPLNIYLLLYECNLIIGLFNLIPAYPLDGGRIIRGILNYKYIYKKANLITVYISLILGIFLIFIYLFLFFAGKSNISLGLIALFIIISSIKERERITYIIMGDIIKKKNKFLKRGYIENRSISVSYKSTLVSILSIVEKNKYNIFYVLDNEMKVIDLIFEQEIIEGLKLYGNITLEEFMDVQDKNYG